MLPPLVLAVWVSHWGVNSIFQHDSQRYQSCVINSCFRCCYTWYRKLKKYVKTHVRFKIYCPCQREQTKHSNTVTLLKTMHLCLQKCSSFLSIRRRSLTAVQVLLRVCFFFPQGKGWKYPCTWNTTSKNPETEYKTGTTFHLCIPSCPVLLLCVYL